MICKNKTVNFSTKERFSRYLTVEEPKLEKLQGWRRWGIRKVKNNNEIKEFKESREIKEAMVKNH